jgi:hypothetical protein
LYGVWDFLVGVPLVTLADTPDLAPPTGLFEDECSVVSARCTLSYEGIA